MFRLRQQHEHHHEPSAAVRAYAEAAVALGLEPQGFSLDKLSLRPAISVRLGDRGLVETRQLERQMHALVECGEQPHHSGHVEFRWF